MQDLLDKLEPLMIKAFNYAYYKATENQDEIDRLRMMMILMKYSNYLSIHQVYHMEL